jgi:ornithine cyclodeaminase/alanine dehydrogenase-like protein (mu-crystallin family)
MELTATSGSGAIPWLNAVETEARLPFPELVDALQVAVFELAADKIRCPERQVVPMSGGAMLLSMPAVADDLVAHKLITVAPQNKALGLPTILGQLAILDGQSGATRLILDGATVTGRRTAAMSMLGLRALGPRTINRALVIGTGMSKRSRRFTPAFRSAFGVLPKTTKTTLSVSSLTWISPGHGRILITRGTL